MLLLPMPVAAAEPLSPDASFRQGLKAFERGAFEEAAASWAQAAKGYERARKAAEQQRALAHLAEAYSALGQYRQAAAALETAQTLAERSGDRARIASVLSRQGTVHAALGDLEGAERFLIRALALARGIPDTALTAAILNDLGNLHMVQRRPADALDAYGESLRLAEKSGRRLLTARALTNTANALQQKGEVAEAEKLLDRAVRELQPAAPSHDVAFTLVNVGLAFQGLHAARPQPGGVLVLKASSAFREAAAVAEKIGDRRTVSYAWGHLGTLYENEGRHEEALELTRRALFAAQQVNAPESLYRWQWQSARLLKKTGAPDAALASYRRAVATLQSIRQELTVRSGELPASFRDTQGPLYFELVDLLLQQAGSQEQHQEIETSLNEAREVVELFKAAELRDFFRDDCVDLALAKATRLDIVSQTAVIVYPILLTDRTELLVSLPTGLKRVQVAVGSEALTQEVRQFRRKLEKRTTREFLPHAQQLYDWLIRPLEPDLASLRVETLVFVPDGPLRTIPMAALHDGKQFLVAKYALGTTPGLSLTEPRPINRENTNVLAVGVTQAVQGFPPLPSVSAELQALQGLFPLTSLVDQDFRLSTLEKKLKEEQFTILHVASHGQFGGEPQKTFLLTFDDKLTMDRLDQYIGLFKFRDDPLELLTLSACDTAEGDDRAALGLAGVAVKAGARSALATLWNINDPASAELVAEFYRQLLDPSVSRAVALQRAQLKTLGNPRYDHPGFWAPFLLINNWL